MKMIAAFVCLLYSDDGFQVNQLTSVSKNKHEHDNSGRDKFLLELLFGETMILI